MGEVVSGNARLKFVGLTSVVAMVLLRVLIETTNTRNLNFFLADEPTASHHRVTIVTAYYPLEAGAKHTLEKYDAWMQNFIPCVKVPIVVFLPSGPIQEKVKKMRGELPITIKVSLRTIFIVGGVPPKNDFNDFLSSPVLFTSRRPWSYGIWNLLENLGINLKGTSTTLILRSLNTLLHSMPFGLASHGCYAW